MGGGGGGDKNSYGDLFRMKDFWQGDFFGSGGGGGTGGSQSPTSRTPFSHLPYVFVPLFPDSLPLLCFSHYHVNHAV